LNLVRKVSRREFLKFLGAGSLAGLLSTLGAADLFKLTVPSKKSRLDAEEVDGQSISSGSSKPSNPSEGELFHDLNGGGISHYNGSEWEKVDDSV
jgi:hypothetical protein